MTRSLLSGPVYTARDAGSRAAARGALAQPASCRYGLAGQTLFYAGPTPAAAGRPVGAVGPTTAKRMDAATPALLRAGIVATIGKGARAEEVRLHAPRPAACTSRLWAGRRRCSRGMSLPPSLSPGRISGTEAFVRMTLADFPVFVAIDVEGNDLYADAPARVAHEWERARRWPSAGSSSTLEGGEGSGKSTQLRALARRLEAAGLPVRVLREPGGTAVGEAVRALLLDPDHTGLDATAELLLYEASRAQLVADVIEPALEAGEIVICDRFYDSDHRLPGLRARPIARAYRRAQRRPRQAGWPRFAPSCSTSTRSSAFERATRHGADRLEGESLAFHRAVRDGFLAIAASEPDRVRVVDAAGDPDAVAERVAAALADIPQLAEALS